MVRISSTGKAFPLASAISFDIFIFFLVPVVTQGNVFSIGAPLEDLNSLVFHTFELDLEIAKLKEYFFVQ